MQTATSQERAELIRRWRSSPGDLELRDQIQRLITNVLHSAWELLSNNEPPLDAGYKKTDVHLNCDRTAVHIPGHFNVSLSGVTPEAVLLAGSDRSEVAVTWSIYPVKPVDADVFLSFTAGIDCTRYRLCSSAPVKGQDRLRAWSRPCEEFGEAEIIAGTAGARVAQVLRDELAALDSRIRAFAAERRKSKTSRQRDAVLAELRKLLRPATWLTVDPDRTPELLETRFGGAPYAEPGEEWPRCSRCRHGLDFVGQVNTADAPAPHSLLPLYSFFFCRDCPTQGDKGEWKIRAYAAPAKDKAITINDPADREFRTRPCAVAINPGQSLPAEENLSMYSIDSTLLADSGERYAVIEERLCPRPAGSSTLGGYWHPHVNEREPTCPDCSQPMDLLIETDSEENGYFWGDYGHASVFVCARHPTRLTPLVEWK